MSEMTWEEIIIRIRKYPEYAELVEKAYFDENLNLNIRRFVKSEEFGETRRLIEQFKGELASLKILDIGAGNGISSVAFAQLGCEVTAVEPDLSETIGSGAINILKRENSLDNLTVISSFGEKLPLADEGFDVVYIRQAMHHAADLPRFISEAARTLKKGGLFLTIRDHVVYDQKDKEWFLQEHPLHKFYGGENAFMENEYREAFSRAGLNILLRLKHFDSVINYFPMTRTEYEGKIKVYETGLRASLRSKIGALASISYFFRAYQKLTESRNGKLFEEKNVPGRMYSFVAKKAI